MAATNTLQYMTMVLNESLRLLHNKLGLAAGVNKEYSDKFARTGAKVGETIYVRKPIRYYVSNGANMVTQNTVEETAAVTLTSRKHVGISFTTQEITTKFDEYSKRVLAPAMAVLAMQIDLDGLALAKQVYNSVGTPGTTPGSNSGSNLATCNAPTIFTNARALLESYACPSGDRYVVLNPRAEAGVIAGMATLFNASKEISNQYINGSMGMASGFQFLSSPNVNTITLGTRANGTVSGANQTGANLAVTGAGANATVAAGDTFTIADVYSVNPENQQSTGYLQQFVVTTAANLGANGNGTLTVSPSIIVAGANVANGTVNALPANGANLTWQGTANTSTVLNLAYHKDFATLATADLYLPESTAGARASSDGISMRIIKDYSISDDNEYCRIDVLYGWSLLRPELAVKIYG